jgi:hypothetical protein
MKLILAFATAAAATATNVAATSYYCNIEKMQCLADDGGEFVNQTECENACMKLVPKYGCRGWCVLSETVVSYTSRAGVVAHPYLDVSLVQVAISAQRVPVGPRVLRAQVPAVSRRATGIAKTTSPNSSFRQAHVLPSPEVPCTTVLTTLMNVRLLPPKTLSGGCNQLLRQQIWSQW